MFGRKKDRSGSAEKQASARNARKQETSTLPARIPQTTGSALQGRPRASGQDLERLGGAEVVAAAIRTMMAEDRARKKQEVRAEKPEDD